jgi:uncharacterized protein (TIGR02466 family)
MFLDVLPLFSSPVINTQVENVDPSLVLSKMKTLEFELTNQSKSGSGDAIIGISKSLNILSYFPELKSEIESKLDFYIRNVLMYKNVKYKITTSWGTKTSSGGYGQEHMHSNSWLSGVWYPEKSSPILFVKRDRPFLQIEEPEEWNFFNSQQWQIEPEKNTLIIFDSQQNHRVLCNEYDHDRYSIAFNVLPIGRIGTSDSTVYITAK